MLDDLQAFALHLKRYFYWYASGVLHFVVIGYAYYFGPHQVSLQTFEEAHHYKTEAYKSDADSRLKDMEEIENLMDRIQKFQEEIEKPAKSIEEKPELTLTKESDGDTKTEPKPPSSEESAEPLNLLEALAKATEIAKNLDKIEQQERARKLAELTDIPADEALNKLKEEEKDVEASDEPESELSEQEISDKIKDLHIDSISDLELAYEALQESTAPSGSASQDESIKEGYQIPEGLQADIESKLAASGSSRLKAAGESSLSSFMVRYNDGPAKEKRPNGVNARARFPVTGRTIGSGGTIADWVFLDTWYIAGPFTVGQVAAPEYKVDLNAVYAGKNNELIRWKFHQSPNYPLIPPDAEGEATYYGYTEVRTDQDIELWTSLGCDDNCTLWLNGKQVWESGQQFKAWYQTGGPSARTSEIARWDLTEAYEKLHFKKGMNTVLFRLDNNSRELFFSMVLTHKQ